MSVNQCNHSCVQLPRKTVAMQSRKNESGIACCTVETMSSDSDLVDITSVSVHRQMYDRCSANCFSDELADDYVYDDDDDSDEHLDRNVAARRVLHTSSVRTDAAAVPSTNGIVDDAKSLLPSKNKSAVLVAGKMMAASHEFPPQSRTESTSRAAEVNDISVKREPEDGRNNNIERDSSERHKRLANDACDCSSDAGVFVETNTALTEKSTHEVVDKTVPAPFGFPPRSHTEIMSRAVELLDSNLKRESVRVGSTELGSVASGIGDGTVQSTTEFTGTLGNVFLLSVAV